MSTSSLRILVIAANPAAAERTRRLLASALGESTELPTVGNVAAAEAWLAQGDAADLAVLDAEGDAAVTPAGMQQLQASSPWLPVVVLADQLTETAEEALFRVGAQDCLNRQNLTPLSLARAARSALARHRATAGLRSTEEFFRLISENVTDLIAVLDRHGRRLYNSPSYARTLGHHADLAGTNSFAEIHPEDREQIQRVFRETLNTGEGRRAEFRLVLPDGAVRHIESLGSVIRDEHGQPDRVVVVSRDVTERHEATAKLEQALAELRTTHEALQAAQQRLLESEKFSTLSTFAGTIAHEVKNPLQTLLLGLEFFKAGLAPDDTAAASVVTEMENAARKADAVIRGLTEFASYSRHEIGDHDLTTLVQQALRAIAAELRDKDLRLNTEWAETLPRVRLDARKARHIFLKLMLNAIAAARRDGELRVRTRADSTPPANRVVVEIETDGPSLAAAAGEFGTSATNPTTLNVAVVRKVVELLGGRVDTGAREDGGARIAVSFNAVVSPSPATPSPSPAPTP
jgi:PAS domain S-box-containing protein